MWRMKLWSIMMIVEDDVDIINDANIHPLLPHCSLWMIMFMRKRRKRWNNGAEDSCLYFALVCCMLKKYLYVHNLNV